VYYLEFNEKLQNLSAEDFIEFILKELNVDKVFCGFDYRFGNKGLGTPDLISENGILISEHPSGTKPLKWNFPKRNRIIAALSDGILIAESFKSGGALITAELGFKKYSKPQLSQRLLFSFCSTKCLLPQTGQ